MAACQKSKICLATCSIFLTRAICSEGERIKRSGRLVKGGQRAGRGSGPRMARSGMETSAQHTTSKYMYIYEESYVSVGSIYAFLSGPEPVDSGPRKAAPKETQVHKRFLSLQLLDTGNCHCEARILHAQQWLAKRNQEKGGVSATKHA